MKFLIIGFCVCFFYLTYFGGMFVLQILKNANGVILCGIKREVLGSWFIPPAQVLSTVAHAMEGKRTGGRALGSL